jgi:hypothetical protein
VVLLPEREQVPVFPQETVRFFLLLFPVDQPGVLYPEPEVFPEPVKQEQ